MHDALRHPATDAGAPRVRVLVLINKAGNGGAERFAVELATRLDPSRFDVRFCATRKGSLPGQMAYLSAHGVPSFELDRTRARELRAWLPLLRYLRRERIEVVHAHMHSSNVWATLVGRLMRTPVVVATEHTWSFEGKPLRRFLDREVIGRMADKVVAVSDRDREQMIAVEGVPADKIRVIYTGLAPHVLAGHMDGAARVDLRAELGLPSDAPIVGTVCVLRPQKALEVLLEAHARVRESRPDVQLVIVGKGPERDRLDAVVRRLGTSDSVHFLGLRHDVPALLPAMDVFAISSSFEGSPLALLEAMAAERPVASTAVGGIPHIAPDGEAAVLVPRGDPAALAEAIGGLLDDDVRRAALGRAARQRVLEHFTFDRAVAQWEHLLLELTGARAARPTPVRRLRSLLARR